MNSTLKWINRSAYFAPLQGTQNTEYSCTNLTYNIFLTGQYELIELRVDGVQPYAEESHPTINVTLLPCPPGFQLSNVTAQCECAPLLKDRGLLCNISGAMPLVRRTKSVWISTHPNEIDTILHDNCPLDYCIPFQLWLSGAVPMVRRTKSVWVSSYPSIMLHDDCSLDYCKPTPLWLQGAYQCSGLLCGRCKSNHSLAIGTSQCLECTNTHFTLLLPFALAGPMLVLLLIVCNLTVSMGTINGLIFYANIVHVDRAFFFVKPRTFAQVMKIFQRVLVVFIAMLNLILELKPVFLHGMDAYIQTWLQFA